MAARAVYLDTSALVKLISAEAESLALLSFLGSNPNRTSSAIAATEVRRAVRRHQGTIELIDRAERLLRTLTLIPLDDPLLKVAGVLNPPGLRSLDAIHLAAALYLGDHLEIFVAYDSRLLEAARAMALPVATPGQLAR